MTEYTPSTAQVRDCYVWAYYEQTPRQSRAEFGRWLAGIEAAAEKRGAVQALRDAAYEFALIGEGKRTGIRVNLNLHQRADRIETGEGR